MGILDIEHGKIWQLPYAEDFGFFFHDSNEIMNIIYEFEKLWVSAVVRGDRQVVSSSKFRIWKQKKLQPNAD